MDYCSSCRKDSSNQTVLILLLVGTMAAAECDAGLLLKLAADFAEVFSNDFSMPQAKAKYHCALRSLESLSNQAGQRRCDGKRQSDLDHLL